MQKILLFCAALCSIGSMMAATADVASSAEKRAAIMRINEENPNYCLVVTTMYFEEDSIPVEKGDYTYDSDRNVVSWFGYQMTDSGWMCNRYEFYEHVYLPGDTTEITFTHEWNYGDGEWFPVSGFKLQTITNGNVKLIESWQTLDGDSTQWKEYQKEQRTYDANGRQTESISYQWKDEQWVPSFRNIWAYAEDGEEILRQQDNWYNEAWLTMDKDEILRTDTSYHKNSYYRYMPTDELKITNHVYERYDEDGNIIYYLWGGSADRVYETKNYTYSNGLLANLDIYKEDYSSLVLKEQYFYQYDAFNRVVEQKYLSFNYDNIYLASRLLTTYVSDESELIAGTLQIDSICYDDKWVPVTKKDYTYTAAGNPLLKVKSNFNAQDSIWQYEEKEEYAYNDADQERYWALYEWDLKMGQWQGIRKQETEFNAEGVPVSDISYTMTYGDTTWIPERGIVRMFDVYGNFLGEGWYGRNEEGEWVNLGKQLMVYICGDIPTPVQPVVVEPGHDFVTFAWLSYEDANTYTLTVLNSAMTDTIAIMNFNSFGELISQSAPLSPRREQAIPSSSSVFTCLIEGLETATQYVFIMEAKDEAVQVVHTEQGNFNTEGYVSALETIKPVREDNSKILINGSLLIRSGERLYNAQGQQLR